MHELERVLGYTFRNEGLLERALTRKAYAKEHGLGDAHQEALATLGDAVMDVVVLEELIGRGVLEKGELSRRRARAVYRESLNRIARGMGLERYVRFGAGERASGIWEHSHHVLSECLEALIGAVYLDGGMEEAGRVVRRIIPIS